VLQLKYNFSLDTINLYTYDVLGRFPFVKISPASVELPGTVLDVSPLMLLSYLSLLDKKIYVFLHKIAGVFARTGQHTICRRRRNHDGRM
jgi:hypothetical protein